MKKLLLLAWACVAVIGATAAFVAWAYLVAYPWPEQYSPDPAITQRK